MKLLLIATVICIHTSGFLTTAEAKCQPRYNGGYGGTRGRNVIPGWTFNPETNRCELVMTKGRCSSLWNCFSSSGECEYDCDPRMKSWKLT
uniref:Putative salivary kunitz domain protein n=1 Tax=Ixodes ricinus TaxID=34613 RepID=A0A0K8R5Q7_IXORI